MEYHRGKISVLFGGGRSGDERGAMFYLVKNIVTTLYAVLIRQIVICPCLYGPLIQAACEGDAPVGLWNGVGKPSQTIHKIDDRKLARRAQRVKRWKLRGDRGIMWLLVVHFAVVFTAIFLLASHLEGAPYLGEREKNTPQRHHAALLIFYSEVCSGVRRIAQIAPQFEIKNTGRLLASRPLASTRVDASGPRRCAQVINFWFWFVKFAPLFISASRHVETPSRRRRDSSPGMMEVGGLFFDSEPFRTASGPPSRRVGERARAVAAMAS